MRIRSWKTAVLGLALAVLVATSLLSTQSLDVGAVAHGGDAEVARGQYLATIMDCAGCHTPGALAGQPEPDRRLASSVIGFALPGGGIVYPKNLTPDLETGLGRWTEEEVARAIRQGEGRLSQERAARALRGAAGHRARREAGGGDDGAGRSLAQYSIRRERPAPAVAASSPW